MRIIITLFIFSLLTSFSSSEVADAGWMSFEEAVVKMEGKQKKLFIDVYTDWCGWCKKMDATTFADPRVASYLGENFYPVKFNAEQKEEIVFNNHTFKFVANGRRGYHELAAALLNGKLSYPSVVFLNEKYEIIQVLPGFRKADEFLKIAKFIGDDHYLNTPWPEYSEAYDSEQSDSE